MHLNKLDLNLLVAFRALMEHRNVTRAARELGITQPALSHALARLRNHYQDPLFFYVKGTMQLTPRAMEIYEPVAKALESIAATFEWTFDPATVRRTFRIGLVNYFSLLLVPALLVKLREEASGIQLLIDYKTAEEANRLLGTPELDFTLGTISERNPKHVEELLSIDQFVVIARRGHERIGGQMTLEKYAGMKHVFIPFYVSLVDEMLKKQGVIRGFSLETDNIWGIPFLVSRSDLLATIPERVAFVFQKFCRLDLFPAPLSNPRFRLNIGWHERAQHDPAHTWLRKVVPVIANSIYRDLGAPIIES